MRTGSAPSNNRVHHYQMNGQPRSSFTQQTTVRAHNNPETSLHEVLYRSVLSLAGKTNSNHPKNAPKYRHPTDLAHRRELSRRNESKPPKSITLTPISDFRAISHSFALRAINQSHRGMLRVRRAAPPTESPSLRVAGSGAGTLKHASRRGSDRPGGPKLGTCLQAIVR